MQSLIRSKSAGVTGGRGTAGAGPGRDLLYFGLSPILRALDAKKQIVGTHRSRQHNLQHPCAPKYAIFHENRPKMALFLSNIGFLALYKQLKDPPHYFEGAGCKKRSCGHTKITKTHFVASVCTTICRFSWKKTAKNGHFLVKK